MSLMARSKRQSGPPAELNPLQQQHGFAGLVDCCLTVGFGAALLAFGTAVPQLTLDMTTNSIKTVYKTGAAIVLLGLMSQNRNDISGSGHQQKMGVSPGDGS